MAPNTPTRRHVLQWGGVGLVVGIAGCGDNDGGNGSGDGDDDTDETVTEESTVPEALRRELPDPNRYISGTRADYQRATGTVRIDTETGSLVLEGPGPRRVTGIAGYLLAEDLEPADNWGGEVTPDTHRIGTNATYAADEVAFDPGTFEGVALRADAGIDLVVDGETVAEDVSTVRYHPSEGLISPAGDGGPETPSRNVPEVLRRSLPDPDQYVSGQRAGYEREVGAVGIDTAEGSLVLAGPGNRVVTTIAGYLAAEDLEPMDNWGGEVDDETKRIGTNATFGQDELSFAPGSFEGIALRANAGIVLSVDGETVARDAGTVRYHESRGVFEEV